MTGQRVPFSQLLTVILLLLASMHRVNCKVLPRVDDPAFGYVCTDSQELHIIWQPPAAEDGGWADENGRLGSPRLCLHDRFSTTGQFEILDNATSVTTVEVPDRRKHVIFKLSKNLMSCRRMYYWKIEYGLQGNPSICSESTRFAECELLIGDIDGSCFSKFSNENDRYECATLPQNITDVLIDGCHRRPASVASVSDQPSMAESISDTTTVTTIGSAKLVAAVAVSASLFAAAVVVLRTACRQRCLPASQLSMSEPTPASLTSAFRLMTAGRAASRWLRQHRREGRVGGDRLASEAGTAGQQANQNNYDVWLLTNPDTATVIDVHVQEV